MKPFDDGFPVVEVLVFLARHEDGIESRQLYNFFTLENLTSLRRADFSRNLRTLHDLDLARREGAAFEDALYYPRVAEEKVCEKLVAAAVAAYVAKLKGVKVKEGEIHVVFKG